MRNKNRTTAPSQRFVVVWNTCLVFERSMGGLVFRGIGIVRAKANVAMTNLTYNIARLTQIYRYHKDWVTV